MVLFCLGQCEADDWKIPHQYFQYQEVVGRVCMLNSLISSYDEIAQTTTPILELMTSTKKTLGVLAC